MDHEIVYTVLCNHMKKEAYLQNDESNGFRVNKIATEPSVDYIPFSEPKSSFKPSNSVRSLFDTKSSSDETNSLLRFGREETNNPMFRF